MVLKRIRSKFVSAELLVTNMEYAGIHIVRKVVKCLKKALNLDDLILLSLIDTDFCVYRVRFIAGDTVVDAYLDMQADLSFCLESYHPENKELLGLS